MPEPPALFSEAKKPAALQQKVPNEKVEWGIETSKLEADDSVMNKIMSQPISFTQEPKVEPRAAEEPKLLKSKVVEEKAPTFNIETTTMDAPEIIVPQPPVATVSAPPPVSPFNQSQALAKADSTDDKMARFKEHQQKEAQKEISFNIETSTVDADIETPKPSSPVAKPAAAPVAVKPAAQSPKVEPSASSNFKIEETVATPSLLKGLVKSGAETAQSKAPAESASVKHVQKLLGKEKGDLSAETVFEEAIGKTLEDASDFSVAQSNNNTLQNMLFAASEKIQTDIVSAISVPNEDVELVVKVKDHNQGSDTYKEIFSYEIPAKEPETVTVLP